jgi:hypothetical protein
MDTIEKKCQNRQTVRGLELETLAGSVLIMGENNSTRERRKKY